MKAVKVSNYLANVSILALLLRILESGQSISVIQRLGRHLEALIITPKIGKISRSEEEAAEESRIRKFNKRLRSLRMMRERERVRLAITRYEKQRRETEGERGPVKQSIMKLGEGGGG